MNSKKTNTTYFGLPIYEENLVKKEDIEKLPFYEFWEQSSFGSTMLKRDNKVFIYLRDWENFSKLFIEKGINRYSKTT